MSILWGWVICSAMSLCVAACMAEITSSLPISGGPYYWCALLMSVMQHQRCHVPALSHLRSLQP